MGTTQKFIVSVLVGTGAIAIVKGFQLSPIAACVVGQASILLNTYLTGRK